MTNIRPIPPYATAEAAELYDFYVSNFKTLCFEDDIDKTTELIRTLARMIVNAKATYPIETRDGTEATVDADVIVANYLNGMLNNIANLARDYLEQKHFYFPDPVTLAGNAIKLRNLNHKNRTILVSTLKKMVLFCNLFIIFLF